MRHSYMDAEELGLYHKKYEMEPFFATTTEKQSWKRQKKQEKLMREERRRILKHEREMREIKEAYDLMMAPGYAGDEDVDHLIQERREGTVHARAAAHGEREVVYTTPAEYHTTVTRHSVPIHYVDSESESSGSDGEGEYQAYLAWKRRRHPVHHRVVREVPYETRRVVREVPVETRRVIEVPVETRRVVDVPVETRHVVKADLPVKKRRAERVYELPTTIIEDPKIVIPDIEERRVVRAPVHHVYREPRPYAIRRSSRSSSRSKSGGRGRGGSRSTSRSGSPRRVYR